MRGTNERRAKEFNRTGNVSCRRFLSTFLADKLDPTEAELPMVKLVLDIADGRRRGSGR